MIKNWLNLIEVLIKPPQTDARKKSKLIISSPGIFLFVVWEKKFVSNFLR